MIDINVQYLYDKIPNSPPSLCVTSFMNAPLLFFLNSYDYGNCDSQVAQPLLSTSSMNGGPPPLPPGHPAHYQQQQQQHYYPPHSQTRQLPSAPPHGIYPQLPMA